MEKFIPLFLVLLGLSLKLEVDGRQVETERRAENIFMATEETASDQQQRGGRHDPTNQWAIYAPGLEDLEVEKMARRMGFEKVGQVGKLDGYYLLRTCGAHLRTRRSTAFNTLMLMRDARIKWAARQRSMKRFKRELRVDLQQHQQHRRQQHNQQQQHQQHRRQQHQRQQHRRHEVRAYNEINFNDDFWPSQWYLHDRRPSKVFPKIDLHVIPVWAKNITGRGVVVSIIDDGLEYNHTDLKDNYDPEASWDFNDKDSDPFPRYDDTNENKHGTRCAGEIAMTANNKFCAVGVAFNAKVGGIRMLDGTTTDSLEAMSLSFKTDHIDIFSASWGPSDDGKSLEKPGRLAQAALEKGTSEGRRGKGVIYVWASGNGGIVHDNCNCDGYTGSIYTLSISSASQKFQSPWYAEHCSSTFASTYSSGMLKEDRVISTDLHNQCTTSHTGTSASAPLAAGIVALMLEANPDLTWRDVQHLVAWTSEFAPLRRNEGWQMNGAGFWVNNKFGFGLLNAAALVEAADPQSFVTVPQKHVCTFRPRMDVLPAELTSGHFLEISIAVEFRTLKCRPINYLEHVVLILDMDYSRRGNIEVFLRSPSGMNTQLLSIRRTDNSSAGFARWPFSSVHNWGENPKGTWIIIIVDSNDGKERGVVKDLILELHGTIMIPDHVIRGGMRRSYNYDYPLPDDSDDSQQDEGPSDLNDDIRELLEGLKLSRHGKITIRN